MRFESRARREANQAHRLEVENSRTMRELATRNDMIIKRAREITSMGSRLPSSDDGRSNVDRIIVSDPMWAYLDASCDELPLMCKRQQEPGVPDSSRLAYRLSYTMGTPLRVGNRVESCKLEIGHVDRESWGAYVNDPLSSSVGFVATKILRSEPVTHKPDGSISEEVLEMGRYYHVYRGAGGLAIASSVSATLAGTAERVERMETLLQWVDSDAMNPNLNPHLHN